MCCVGGLHKRLLGRVWIHFKKLITAASIPETHFHDLRHMYTVAFTLDVYGHVSERMKKESAQRMEGFIKGITKGQ